MDFVNICCKALYFRGSLSICPAYAGVILGVVTLFVFLLNLSRVCGDDPHVLEAQERLGEFVPRMRG